MALVTAFVAVKIGLEYHTPLQFAGIRFYFRNCYPALLADSIDFSRR